jgi:RNA polymerase sigma-70 factor (ECF subfamily)
MPGSAPSPDLFLARRAAAGQSDAWEELVNMYGRRIYNMALQFAGNPDEAEDLTQEIFLRLYRNLGRFRGDVPLIAWTMRLSKNLCIDHYRRLRREQRWTRVPEIVLNHLPGTDNPEAESQQRQKIEAVFAVLAELSENLAELVLLCDLQGWSLKETAAYLEIPLGTLKSRLHRARNQVVKGVEARLAPTARQREIASC